ncbi:ROK family protein [Lacticaseibacillus pantheris]
MKRLVGSVEAGGTKFVCAVGDSEGNVINRIQIPTTNPDETLARVTSYFLGHPVEAVSVASFGPIEIRRESPKYGYVTSTPKRGWADINFIAPLKDALHVPIYWTTDVNGSAYGEYYARTKRRDVIESLVYYTIGTGVGAGCVINGRLLGSVGHPEMGHVLVKRHPDDLRFKGICPYHGDCLEGLVSGPTFEARMGRAGKDVSMQEPVWDVMAYYVAQAVMQTTLTIRPDRIVFGGGVSSEKFLDKVRLEFSKLLNGYVEVPKLREYISMPVVPDNGSATLGNLILAGQLNTSLK